MGTNHDDTGSTHDKISHKDYVNASTTHDGARSDASQQPLRKERTHTSQHQQHQKQQQQQQQPYQQPQQQNNHYHEHREHHADELKPVAKNIVMQESIDENKRQIASRKSIERYKMGGVLGEGAFSVVYSAVDLVSKEKVAIKIIKKYQLDQKQRDNVLKEVNLMKQLNHPNIVRLIEFIENENYFYLVQEVVSGGEIFNQIVKYTYFSEDLSRHVIIQVAEALLYMHEQVGIVHRDLKPENIFFKPIKVVKEDQKTRLQKLRKSDTNAKLDEGKFVMNYGGGGIGLIKIGDFGLSKQIVLNENNSLKTPCGTIGYTAPEIVRDMKYSKEVDMWALGCVLYILLCGFPPFFNDSIEELTKTVARGEFKFLSPWWDEISSGAKNCVSKLLTVNPIQRYTVEQFLKDPWILEFLNRSENIQEQEKLKKKQSAATSNAAGRRTHTNNPSTSTTTSATTFTQGSRSTSNDGSLTFSSRDTSVPGGTLFSSEDSTIPCMKRTPSGMPGFEPITDSAATSTDTSKNVPLNPFPSVYSESLLHIDKVHHMDVDDKGGDSHDDRHHREYADDNSGEYDSDVEVDDYDDDDNDDEDTPLSKDDQSMYDYEYDGDYGVKGQGFGVELTQFQHKNGSTAVDAIPMLEHHLDPAPAQSSLREEQRSSEKGRHSHRYSHHHQNQHPREGASKRGKRKVTSAMTPEVKAMKEMYDISIAARRMHEEAQYTPGVNAMNGFNELNIVEENEDSDGVVHGSPVEVKPSGGMNKSKTPMFQLNMNDASILARRQKKKGAVAA